MHNNHLSMRSHQNTQANPFLFNTNAQTRSQNSQHGNGFTPAPSLRQNSQIILSILQLVQGLLALLNQQQGASTNNNHGANCGCPCCSAGDNNIHTHDGNDIISITGNNAHVDGGAGDDTAILKGRPIDYSYTLNDQEELIVRSQDDRAGDEHAHAHGNTGVHNQHTSIQDGTEHTLVNFENIRFEAIGDRAFTPEDLAENPLLTDRGNLSIFGDTTNNRLLVMNNATFEMVQEIPVPGGESVYSVDYVTPEKGYITPRASNFVQVLEQSAEGPFVLGERIPLPFAPRTPNRNDSNGLVLYTGSDKPMWALIDSETDKVVAQGGRDEVTQGSFSNYDSRWATGHGQWISDTQFLVPDRESKEISLYSVAQDPNGNWDVTKTDTLDLPESVHTFFGTKTNDNGDILTYAPGEGSNANNNEDSHLYQLKVSGDSLSIHRSVNTTGGLHHPGTHPDGKVLYVPTSNATVDIVDIETFEILKTIPAGKGAGHVTFIPERNLALINNHGDEFVTAVDMRDHSVIKHIPVTTDNPDVDDSLQAHTARVGKEGNYYYNFATDQGTYFRINLDTLELDGTVFTGGTPKQASQPGEIGHVD